MEHDARCVNFANICAERVQLLEAYRQDADEQIKNQAQELVITKNDLESEKNKRTVIIPVVAAVLGLVAGFLITR